MKTEVVEDRFHGLDASRGVLMSLGILLHCANIYKPGTTGGITDSAAQSSFLGLLADSIHLFRMPAFFWIAGFFCARTFYRAGARALIQSRLPRLVIPFFATFLTLNLLQDIIVGLSEGKSTGDVLADGIAPYHLWFLVNLTVYTAISAIPFSPIALQSKGWLISWKPTQPVAFAAIVLTTYGIGLAVRATGQAYYPVLGIVSPYGLAKYAPYFAFGALMYRRLDLRDQFLRQSSWLFFPALALGVILEPMTIGTATWRTEAAQIAQLASIWVCLGALHTFFHRSFQRKTWFTEIAARSSYTVYLFHYVFVAALGAIFVRLTLNPLLEFAVICVITLVATLCIHYWLIERFDFLRLCFNGRWGTAVLNSTNPSHRLRLLTQRSRNLS